MWGIYEQLNSEYVSNQVLLNQDFTTREQAIEACADMVFSKTNGTFSKAQFLKDLTECGSSNIDNFTYFIEKLD